jgi:type VI secretion system protein VasD
MSGRGHVLQIVFWFFLIVGLAGCSGGPTPIRVKGALETSPDLNPDFGGRPSPVVLRVYQLRSPDPFQNADFFSLFDNELATLGQNLISRDEFELQPGESRKYKTELDLATKYIGVVAAFRDLENSRWRALTKLPDKEKVRLQIKLESLAVSISAK